MKWPYVHKPSKARIKSNIWDCSFVLTFQPWYNVIIINVPRVTHRGLKGMKGSCSSHFRLYAGFYIPFRTWATALFTNFKHHKLIIIPYRPGTVLLFFFQNEVLSFSGFLLPSIFQKLFRDQNVICHFYNQKTEILRLCTI